MSTQGVNATAFILLPPNHIGPHWHASVQFRRELYTWLDGKYQLLSDGFSDNTEVFPLSFRPDARFGGKKNEEDFAKALELRANGELCVAGGRREG